MGPESQPADDSRFAREGGGIRRFADKLKDSLNLARHRASNAVQLCMCTCTALVRDGSQYLIYSLSWLRPPHNPSPNRTVQSLCLLMHSDTEAKMGHAW